MNKYTAMRRDTLIGVSAALLRGPEEARESVLAVLAGNISPAWRRALGACLSALDGDISYPGTWGRGNGKLPFLHISTLPGAGHCPGAGECLKFCYSFKAWRYPYGFARQFINSALLSTAEGRAAVLASLDKATARQDSITVRLYVDGDFSSAEILEYWMHALRARPKIRAYGYSKSFKLFAAYAGPWPANYVLNVSSGHNGTASDVAAVRALPITRGDFIAVADVTATKAEHGSKVFVCPLKCGDCLGGAHACGQLAISKPIIIGVH